MQCVHSNWLNFSVHIAFLQTCQCEDTEHKHAPFKFNLKSLLVHHNCCKGTKVQSINLNYAVQHFELSSKFNIKMKFNKRVSGSTEVAPRSSLKSSRARNDLAAGNFIVPMDEWRCAVPCSYRAEQGRTSAAPPDQRHPSASPGGSLEESGILRESRSIPLPGWVQTAETDGDPWPSYFET